MMPFWFGTIVGLAQWIAVVTNIVGSATVPGFDYGIIVAQFIFLFSFGLNQWLQYRRIGRWADYAFGEKTYLVLASKRSRCWLGRSTAGPSATEAGSSDWALEERLGADRRSFWR